MNASNPSQRIERTARIAESFRGQRIDSVLAQLFSEFSRSQLTQWLKEKTIQVNGHHLKPKEKVLGGEWIELSVTLQAKTSLHDEAEDIPLSIVHEDESLLVINKPAGLVVHPGAGNPDHTLMHALLHHDPALQLLPRAGIIHRLDKDTTGLLIVAKHLTAHTSLIRDMQERHIQRRYLTLVHGHLISGGVIDTAYGRHPTNRLKKAVTREGRQAITHYKLSRQYKQFTLLEVQLLTGRTHQIRVHMAHMGHPVLGDQLYGGRSRYPLGADQLIREMFDHFKRQALHAYFLELTHPMTQERLTLTAPLPHDFQQLLTALEPYALSTC